MLAGTAAASLAPTAHAADSATITRQKNTWTLQNDALRVGSLGYLLEDISLYNDGLVRYAFRGKRTGAELKAPGFEVNFAASRSLAKAFWLQELVPARAQVLYADDKITSYSEHWDGQSLVVRAQGAANATGTLVVYTRMRRPTPR